MYYSEGRMGRDAMNIYKKMYLHLFNAVTNVISTLGAGNNAAGHLRKVQQECEEMYISHGEKKKEAGK